MASKHTDEELERAVAAYAEAGGIRSEAARNLGIPRQTFNSRLEAAQERLGVKLGPVAGGKTHGIEHETRELPPAGEVRRYILTSAQNNTRANTGVLENLKALAYHYGAELIVGTFTYNKSAYGNRAVKRGTFRPGDTDELWYDPQLEPFIVDRRVELAPGLVWCGEMNILPTASDPLSGFESYTGRNSAIFPHAKMELRSIASGKLEGTKINYTTGAITLRNYIQKKAGFKAEFHHVYGALIAEVDSDGAWYVRQLNADKDEGVQDLTLYAQLGQVTDGHHVEAITWGDLHVRQMDPSVRAVAWDYDGMLDKLRPRYQFMHDSLAFSTGRSHHDLKSPVKRFEKFMEGDVGESVAEEMAETAEFLNVESLRLWCKTVVVDSNHDRHLKRWIEETDYRDDHVNALFYLSTAFDLYNAIKRGEPDFHLVEHVLRKAGVSDEVRFLRRDESFVICRDRAGGIECGMHGDEGANGSRGTPLGLSKFGRKANIADKHSTEIRQGLYVAGTSSLLDLGYNSGPSSWSHSHVVTYPNGKRAIVTMWNDKYRA